MKTSFKIELVLIIALIISCISSFFTKIYTYTEIIAGITLITHSYNNKNYIKRKYMTNIYLLFGILSLLLALWEVLNG